MGIIIKDAKGGNGARSNPQVLQKPLGGGKPQAGGAQKGGNLL